MIKQLWRVIRLEIALQKCQRELKRSAGAVDYGVVRITPPEPNEAIEQFSRDFRAALWSHLTRKPEVLTQFGTRDEIVPSRACQVVQRPILKAHKQLKAARISCEKGYCKDSRLLMRMADERLEAERQDPVPERHVLRQVVREEVDEYV
jgi:hypothetical protein